VRVDRRLVIGVSLALLEGCVRFTAPAASGDTGGAVDHRSSDGLRELVIAPDRARDQVRDWHVDRRDQVVLDQRRDQIAHDLARDMKLSPDHLPDKLQPDKLQPCDDSDVCTVDTVTTTGCQHSTYDAGPCLDQKLLTTSAVTDISNYMAQTFTAGKTGTLAGVNVSVYVVGGTTYPLHVAIRNLNASGWPSQVLAETTLGTSACPITQLITFPQAVSIVAGTQYAIVLNYPAAGGGYGGSWQGATGNAYPGGTALKSSDGVSWTEVMGGLDQDFRTYVR
jgi:hypothetical protein